MNNTKLILSLALITGIAMVAMFSWALTPSKDVLLDHKAAAPASVAALKQNVHLTFMKTEWFGSESHHLANVVVFESAARVMTVTLSWLALAFCFTMIFKQRRTENTLDLDQIKFEVARPIAG